MTHEEAVKLVAAEYNKFISTWSTATTEAEHLVDALEKLGLLKPDQQQSPLAGLNSSFVTDQTNPLQTGYGGWITDRGAEILEGALAARGYKIVKV